MVGVPILLVPSIDGILLVCLPNTAVSKDGDGVTFTQRISLMSSCVNKTICVIQLSRAVGPLTTTKDQAINGLKSYAVKHMAQKEKGFHNLIKHI